MGFRNPQIEILVFCFPPPPLIFNESSLSEANSGLNEANLSVIV